MGQRGSFMVSQGGAVTSLTAGVEAGWTSFLPTTATEVRYVAADGNDGTGATYTKATGFPNASFPDPFNPGPVLPFLTIGAAFTGFASGDRWVLFKRGHTFTQTAELPARSGAGVGVPFIYGAYGSLTIQRPILQSGHFAILNLDNTTLTNVVLLSLDCYAHLRDPNNPLFDGAPQNDNAIDSTFVPQHNWIIEDCVFRYYDSGVFIAGNQGYPATDVPGTNILTRRCTVHHSWQEQIPPGSPTDAQNFFHFNNNNLLIEECLVYSNDWVAGEADVLSHNIYLHAPHRNAIIRGNLIFRASAHGIHSRKDIGDLDAGAYNEVIIENNFCAWNPLGITTLSSHTIVRNNVIMESTDINDPAPPDPRGVGSWCEESVINGSSPETVYHDNIFANGFTAGLTGYREAFGLQQSAASTGQPFKVTFRNNLIYNWNAQGMRHGTSGKTQANGHLFTIRDNIIQQPNISPFGAYMSIHDSAFEDAYVYSGNTYFSAHATNHFNIGGLGNRTYAQWLTDSGETGSSFTQLTFADPTRTIERYCTEVLGIPGTLDAFIAEARLNRKGNWRLAYTAAAVNAWIRAGFVQV